MQEKSAESRIRKATSGRIKKMEGEQIGRKQKKIDKKMRK